MPRRRKRAPALAVLAALCGAVAGGALAPRQAAADASKSASLSWVELPGAEGCGGALAVAKDVEKWLGRRALRAPSEAELSIEARVDHVGDSRQWRAVVELRDARGTVLGVRELTSDGEDCSSLKASASLAIALMIDPDAGASPQAAPPNAPPAAPPPAPAAPAPARVSEQAPAKSNAPCRAPSETAAPWRIAWGLGPVAALGVLPEPAAGVQVDASATPPQFVPLHLFARDYVSQRRLVTPGASVHLASTSAGATLCPLRLERTRRIALDACAGGELATVETDSEGLGGAQAHTATVFRLLADAHVSVRLGGPFSVRAGGEGGVALARDALVYEDVARAQHQLFDPELVAVCLDAGLLVALP
jgi:hypothetical protein